MFFCGNSYSCGNCGSLASNKTDTIKIDLDDIIQSFQPGQELLAPDIGFRPPAVPRYLEEKPLEEEHARYREEQERLRQERDKREQDEEEGRHQRLWQEERFLLEEKRRLEEEARRIEETERQWTHVESQCADEEHRRRVEALQRARAEKAAKAAERERRRAEKKREEEAQLHVQERLTWDSEQIQQQVGKFLERHGYADVNEQKVRRGAKAAYFDYPLHKAVEMNDADLVEALILAGARIAAGDSNGVTPTQLAERLNQKGSHDEVLNKLHHVHLEQT